MQIGISALIILVLIMFGMSVSGSFLAGAFVFLLWADKSLGSVASTAFYALEKSSILAIPLYMIAGSLMEHGGIADELINFANALLKKIKGAMGATIPLASMFFGAISGSGTATVSALSSIMLPKLTKLGWDKRYTAALLASSASLGYMIPPNMNAILFSVVADCSVAALFMSTVIPGIIWGVLLILVNRFTYSKWYTPVDQSAAEQQPELAANSGQISEESGDRLSEPQIGYWANLFKRFKSAIPALIMPVIIFVGIYGGFFSPTEAGAVSGIYALLIGIFYYRKIKFKIAVNVFKKTGMSMGGFMIILPMVAIFSRYLIIQQVPQTIAAGIATLTTNRIAILLLINLVLLIAGVFLDAGVLILVITPMLIPTAGMIGLSTTQLAVMLFVCVGIGTVTPPMAMNLFITSKASGVPVSSMIKPLMPFLLVGSLPVLLLVTFVPEVSLWLPRILGFSV